MHRDAYLLLESIELHNLGASQQYLELTALGGSTPLGTSDVASLEGDGFAAASRLPTQTSVRKSAFAAFLGKIEIDVIEALHLEWSNVRVPECGREGGWDVRCDRHA